jgi:crossover junction endodeoxyribonuclease RuvC
MTTRVLGIDPGLTRCGVGLIEVSAGRKLKLVSVDTLTSDKSLELSARVGRIGDALEELIKREKPAAIALERVFSQANLRSVMGTAQISGVVLHLANRYRIAVYLHTPTEVKAAVTGSGRANKDQVGKMVAKILGLSQIPKPADAADSLAIAICHAWKNVGATAAGSAQLTPAQKKWHAAEQAATASKRR